MKIQVGEKGKWMTVPQGWEKVPDGDKCRDGDRFANILTFRWDLADDEDCTLEIPSEHFDCLIRRVR